MVSAQHHYALGVADLQGEDEDEDLDGEGASVHVVAQEKVLVGLGIASNVRLQQFDEVVELAVDIADNGDWVLQPYQVGLRFWLWQEY